MIKKKAASRIRLRVKEALLLGVGTVRTAKYRKNSRPGLYNQFLFCNRFLPLEQYLHGRYKDMF